MPTFTPSDAIDMSKERDWAANLGMLDWDNTSIVFTKRTLIEFLKYTGTTVDTNFTNISKLPRYAKFGKITGEEETTPAAAEASSAAATTTATAPPATTIDSGFKPSRRVRTAPGGPTHNIFGGDSDDDALAAAPPRPAAQPTVASTTTASAAEPERPAFIPSRKVREPPGGRDSIADIL
ncbi:hypothetical protein QCA50_002667 [Cerrena zonata]|uniref:Uncharacterized protein n=1 Tax=Cerrena zonata TaxID=2478898 RepID=A0AAW0GKB2_9APHY